MTSPVIAARSPSALAPAAALFYATAGRPMAMRAVALWVAVALPASVVFGGSGLPPEDAVRWLARSALLRLGVLSIAGLLAAPVVGPALVAPGTAVLRSLPIGRAPIAMVAASAALVQLPLGALFVAATAPGAGVALMGSAAALSLAVRAGPLATAAAACGASFVLGARPLLQAPLAAASLGLAAHAAWTRGLEHAASALRASPLVGGAPWRALAAVHALCLARRQRAALTRGALGVLGAGPIAGVAARNRAQVGALASLDSIRVVLVASSLPLLVALAGLCGPVLEEEARLRWALDATGTPSRARHASSALIVAGGGALAGIAIGASALGAGAPAPGAALAARCVLAVSVWGLAAGLALLAWGRATLRDGPRARVRFAIGAAAIGAASLVASALLGEAAAYAGVAAAAAGLVATARAEARRRP